jgi:hypothetical protein
MVRATLDER